MRFVKKILSVMLVMGVLTTTASVQAADAPKPAMANKEAAKDIVLRGDAKCTTCHDEADAPELLAIGKTRHGTNADSRTPKCVDCHGESEKHTNHKGSDKPPKVDRSFNKNTQNSAHERNGACLTCHQGAKRMQWQASLHATNDVGCTSCHKVHSKRDDVRDKVAQADVCYTCHKEQRAQVSRPSRHPIPEGKVTCSDCHNAHGSVGPKMLVKDSVNQTCYECHAEKRGPFLHNHQPVTEDCGICHNPHGTTAANLLKQRQPLLCQNCHNVATHRTQLVQQLAGRNTSREVNSSMASGCLNCHTNIHGSNSTTASGTGGRFRQ